MLRPAALGLVLLAGGGAGAPQNVDVSNARGPQSEVSIAVDPVNREVLVAGSNSYGEATARAYGSTDGGRTWTSTAAPPRPPGAGVPGAVDPSVAVDAAGRQYYSFLATTGRGTKLVSGAFVSARGGPAEAWGTPVQVAASADRPTLAVDASEASPHLGRLYLTWTRFTNGPGAILVRHSDDAGRHWSRTVSASGRTGGGVAATIATGRRGELFVGWDARGRLQLARSGDGGDSFERPVLAATVPTIEPSSPCAFSSGRLPAQPLRCLTPNPIAAVDRSTGRFSGRVYLTYASFRGRSMDVLVTAFDRSLQRVLEARSVTPGRRGGADRFMPVSAVDPSTGVVWVCFYDTAGDPRRVRAIFSCATSRSGGRSWSKPIRVASAPSNAAVPQADENGYGDYVGLAAGGGIAHPAWTDTRRLLARREEIYTARVVRR